MTLLARFRRRRPHHGPLEQAWHQRAPAVIAAAIGLHFLISLVIWVVSVVDARAMQTPWADIGAVLWPDALFCLLLVVGAGVACLLSARHRRLSIAAAAILILATGLLAWRDLGGLRRDAGPHVSAQGEMPAAARHTWWWYPADASGGSTGRR